MNKVIEIGRLVKDPEIRYSRLTENLNRKDSQQRILLTVLRLENLENLQRNISTRVSRLR